jgi:hypothetical protein
MSNGLVVPLDRVTSRWTAVTLVLAGHGCPLRGLTLKPLGGAYVTV